MIEGIGVDIVSTERYIGVNDVHLIRLASFILSFDELNEYEIATNKVAFLAKHFAAKEAYLKAKGTGISKGTDLKTITIKHNKLGAPYLDVPEKTHLSISDERNHVVAMVVIES